MFLSQWSNHVIVSVNVLIKGVPAVRVSDGNVHSRGLQIGAGPQALLLSGRCRWSVYLYINTKGGKVAVLAFVVVQGGVHGSGPGIGRYTVRSPSVGHQHFIHACN